MAKSKTKEAQEAKEAKQKARRKEMERQHLRRLEDDTIAERFTWRKLPNGHDPWHPSCSLSSKVVDTYVLMTAKFLCRVQRLPSALVVVRFQGLPM